MVDDLSMARAEVRRNVRAPSVVDRGLGVVGLVAASDVGFRCGDWPPGASTCETASVPKAFSDGGASNV
jgi:hypothetical protein